MTMKRFVEYDTIFKLYLCNLQQIRTNW